MAALRQEIVRLDDLRGGRFAYGSVDGEKVAVAGVGSAWNAET